MLSRLVAQAVDRNAALCELIEEIAKALSSGVEPWAPG